MAEVEHNIRPGKSTERRVVVLPLNAGLIDYRSLEEVLKLPAISPIV